MMRRLVLPFRVRSKRSRPAVARPAWLLVVSAFIPLDAALAQSPAVNMFSFTSHGGQVALGSPNVFVGGMPMSRVGDFASCPLQCSETQDHSGGEILNGSATVLVNGVPAAQAGVSVIQESCATSTISSGVSTVLIGG